MKFNLHDFFKSVRNMKITTTLILESTHVFGLKIVEILLFEGT